MKILPVHGNKGKYSSNVYLILGEWNRLEDVNTLVDVGSDESVIATIENINTGVGKNRVDQVILTHNHSDHAGILPLVKKIFRPRVYAHSLFAGEVDEPLKDGAYIRAGDSVLEVIHTPGHSSDSISLYDRERGALFVGDAPVVIRRRDMGYGKDYYRALKTICERDVREIYFGHGEPLTHNAGKTLLFTLSMLEENS